MDKVRLDELIAQTPEQTLADYARIDAIIAKGTVTTRKVWPTPQATRRNETWFCQTNSIEYAVLEKKG